MFSKAFVAAALLGAATAVPLGGLPALQKESSTSSGHQTESSPASSSFEQPAPQAAQPAGLPTSAPHGAPSGPPPWAQHGEDRKADFDDLSPVPGAAIEFTDEYKDLYYQGFVTLEAGVAGSVAAGVTPQSAPNVAAYGIGAELVEGPATITADYADSTTKSFDLESMYFGCVVNTVESVVSPPAACTVKATAYDENDYAVAAQNFEYNPAALAARMDRAEFGSGFSNIKKVEFETVATLDEVVSTLFDDIKYTIHKTSPFDELHH